MAANANSWNGGGMGGAPGGASEWVEHTTPQGRVYYYNSRTEASVWEKPESLMTPGEKHLAKCPWKSHKYVSFLIQNILELTSLEMQTIRFIIIIKSPKHHHGQSQKSLSKRKRKLKELTLPKEET